MTASELFQSGQLAAAVTAAADAVRKHPTDIGARAFFAELQCFVGELESADKQLDVILTQKPDSAISTSLFRQLIRAEQSRREVFEQNRVPEFLDVPPPALQSQLQALVALKEGRTADAIALVAAADEQRPTVSGICDGQPFAEIRDLDDLTASFCEVHTSTGKYYWIPWETIESIDLQPIVHPVDILWRPAQMVVRGGPDGVVYLPAIYYGTLAHDDPQLRLGRATDWIGNEGEIVRGVGQRTWLFGEDDRPLLSLTSITFNTP